jgi:hypothetical protein
MYCHVDLSSTISLTDGRLQLQQELKAAKERILELEDTIANGPAAVAEARAHALQNQLNSLTLTHKKLQKRSSRREVQFRQQLTHLHEQHQRSYIAGISKGHKEKTPMTTATHSSPSTPSAAMMMMTTTTMTASQSSGQLGNASASPLSVATSRLDNNPLNSRSQQSLSIRPSTSPSSRQSRIIVTAPSSTTVTRASSTWSRASSRSVSRSPSRGRSASPMNRTTSATPSSTTNMRHSNGVTSNPNSRPSSSRATTNNNRQKQSQTQHQQQQQPLAIMMASSHHGASRSLQQQQNGHSMPHSRTNSRPGTSTSGNTFLSTLGEHNDRHIDDQFEGSDEMPLASTTGSGNGRTPDPHAIQSYRLSQTWSNTNTNIPPSTTSANASSSHRHHAHHHSIGSLRGRDSNHQSLDEASFPHLPFQSDNNDPDAHSGWASRQLAALGIRPQSAPVQTVAAAPITTNRSQQRHQQSEVSSRSNHNHNSNRNSSESDRNRIRHQSPSPSSSPPPPQQQYQHQLSKPRSPSPFKVTTFNMPPPSSSPPPAVLIAASASVSRAKQPPTNDEYLDDEFVVSPVSPHQQSPVKWPTVVETSTNSNNKNNQNNHNNHGGLHPQHQHHTNSSPPSTKVMPTLTSASSMTSPSNGDEFAARLRAVKAQVLSARPVFPRRAASSARIIPSNKDSQHQVIDDAPDDNEPARRLIASASTPIIMNGHDTSGSRVVSARDGVDTPVMMTRLPDGMMVPVPHNLKVLRPMVSDLIASSHSSSDPRSTAAAMAVTSPISARRAITDNHHSGSNHHKHKHHGSHSHRHDTDAPHPLDPPVLAQHASS